MVIKYEKSYKVGKGQSNDIKADVIILGCSLPGIVTAHKLKRKFGDTMDIVVLDMAGPTHRASKCNVSFLTDEDESQIDEDYAEETLAGLLGDDVARNYLNKYANEFSIPIPDFILTPTRMKSPLNKLFQHTNGSAVECGTDFHDFTYLNFIEKFELTQYQALLDHSMRNMFQGSNEDSDSERQKLLYYDQTTMERHICNALLFPTSRDIMRTTVSLVCGAPADKISVLFYFHQCYRTSTSKNHLDGNNTRFREKLLGYCRKRLASQLQRSVADITLPSNPIKEIRTYSDEKVILKTMMGETNYICDLLAMALRPDELHKIYVEDQLLSTSDAGIASRMTPGRAKRFVIEYNDSFWASQGYSGDILSIRGPIIWAMEKPTLSTTGSLERFSSLIGYLKVTEYSEEESKEAVVEQLVKLFGEAAAHPIKYIETDIADIFIPHCGDFVALRRLTTQVSRKYLEWGALDVFAEGDVAAALQAGHTAYVHLLTSLRPQAQTYEDLISAERPTFLADPIERWYSQVNYMSTLRVTVFTAVIIISFRMLKSYLRK